jgi:hypothetical protein
MSLKGEKGKGGKGIMMQFFFLFPAPPACFHNLGGIGEKGQEACSPDLSPL